LSGAKSGITAATRETGRACRCAHADHATQPNPRTRMSDVNPIWLEGQRRRWQRHDWQRFIRHDAHRFAPPGSPEAKMPGYLHPWAAVAAAEEAAEDEARARAAAEQEAFERDVEALRADHERVRIELADVKFALALRRIFHKYSPDQPRDDRGRWTEDGQGTSGAGSTNVSSGRTRLADTGNRAAPPTQTVLSDATPDSIVPGARYAQDATRGRYSVDLHEEEARGGHTIDKHVNKSPEALIAQAREAFNERPDARDVRSGSFSSPEAATKLVNSTLAQNRAIVDQVAGGVLRFETVHAQFDSITGIEAVAAHIGSQVYIRETYGVGVLVVRDPSSPRGYTVWTAFPSNPR